MLSLVAEYSLFEQRNKLTAIFFPEKDEVRRGFLESLTHFLKQECENKYLKLSLKKIFLRLFFSFLKNY